MIEFRKTNDVIRIYRNNERIYTISESTYKCLNSMGKRGDHIVSVIELVCKSQLSDGDAKSIKDYFGKYDTKVKINKARK